MPKLLSRLLFALVEVVLLPVSLLGLVLFTITYLLGRAGSQTSQTAYGPMFSRWLLAVRGERPDDAARRMFFALPGIHRVPLSLMFGPTLLAMRISGHTPKMYLYPAYESAHMVGAFRHRTRFFDEAMQHYRTQVEQIVLLGAGWDTRAYNIIARVEGVTVFEVDDEDTQQAKCEALSRAGVDTNGTIFVSVDFNREEWLPALRRVGFDPNRRTFVLWEGVTYYLESPAVETTLRTVAHEMAPGSAIAFDYVGEHILRSGGEGITKLFLKQAARMGEPWQFGISTAPPARDTLGDYLAQFGLSLQAHEVVAVEEGSIRADGGLALAVNR